LPFADKLVLADYLTLRNSSPLVKRRRAASAGCQCQGKNSATRGRGSTVMPACGARHTLVIFS